MCRTRHVSIRVARNQSPRNLRVDSEVSLVWCASARWSSDCNLVNQTESAFPTCACMITEKYSLVPKITVLPHNVHKHKYRTSQHSLSVCRKLVRRLTTPDLMFGQMIAPPPSSSATKTCVSAEDVLKCFHDTGSPATSELSPIAVSARHTHSNYHICVHCISSLLLPVYIHVYMIVASFQLA